jgi:hypothetical protein
VGRAGHHVCLAVAARRAAPRRATDKEYLERYAAGMCRNIRPLFNFEPPATDEEVQAAALQYVRKVSGARKASGKNLEVFARAVEEVARATRVLVDSLETAAPAKNREEEARKAKLRSAERFG